MPCWDHQAPVRRQLNWVRQLAVFTGIHTLTKGHRDTVLYKMIWFFFIFPFLSMKLNFASLEINAFLHLYFKKLWFQSRHPFKNSKYRFSVIWQINFDDGTFYGLLLAKIMITVWLKYFSSLIFSPREYRFLSGTRGRQM